MTKKLVISASLLAKSQVAAYTRKDGTVVQAHDNGRQAAAPEPVNQKVLAKLKTSHHVDARAQVLAHSASRRKRVRRPQSGVRVPADRGVRGDGFLTSVLEM